MAEITASMVKDLRELTGLGMMECKKALEEAAGDIKKAEELLRIKSGAKASKAAARVAAEGAVGTYLSADGKLAAMVEVNCETDFVARTDAFRTLARDIAMQVAAMNPAALTPEEVPGGLPGEAKDHALLTQAFIKDGSRSIQDLVQEVIAQTGENVRISRFSRFELGGA